MKYEEAQDLKERVVDIVKTLDMSHVDLDRISCLRGFGSSTRRTLARVHALGKVMQKAMKTKAFYTIEFLERFDKLSKKEQDRVIIHELLHVPKTFGGGFRQHDYVCGEEVEKLHRKFVQIKGERDENKNWFW